MSAAIWSCPPADALLHPAAAFLRFCHNHGLIQVNNRPQWYTVRGGARHYVEKIVAGIEQAHLNTPVRRIARHASGVEVHTDAGRQSFDQLVVATHSDQALALLADPSLMEQSVLGRIRYHDNRAVLHTDARCMPERKLAWAAWNYERAQHSNKESAHVCLHYWLNRLQPLPFSQDVFVSLNPVREIDPAKVIAEFSYAHPVFDLAAIQAQREMPSLQGGQRTWFAGAWMGYGFHEDGFQAGRAAAMGVLAS